MELWLLILIVIVLVMAEALHLLNMHRKPSKRFSRRISRRSKKGNSGTNYHLAPRKLVEGGDDFDWAKFKVMRRA